MRAEDMVEVFFLTLCDLFGRWPRLAPLKLLWGSVDSLAECTCVAGSRVPQIALQRGRL